MRMNILLFMWSMLLWLFEFVRSIGRQIVIAFFILQTNFIFLFYIIWKSDKLTYQNCEFLRILYLNILYKDELLLISKFFYILPFNLGKSLSLLLFWVWINLLFSSTLMELDITYIRKMMEYWKLCMCLLHSFIFLLGMFLYSELYSFVLLY